MDTKFLPAVAAVRSGDLQKFKQLVAEDPSLATLRSSTSHPTLLQCVALDGKDKPNNVEMAAVLVDAGAELNEPLVAAASINNRGVAELLLDRGAAIDGTGGWTPLEEALYWNSQDVIALLLERGVAIQNLRIAAGLGSTDLIENYFNDDGTLKPEAGKINWPWGDLEAIAHSNHDAAGKRTLTDRVNEWSQDQQGIINNAFVYACMHGHIDAAKLLLEKGAQVDVVPGGFDYAGTGLHYAALNGHRPMVEFLLDHGADRNVKDTKVKSTAAGWADHAGHTELRDLLQ
ncbi:MAG TPA: ankyrin repeat domain-containing protein [Pyrinomonadaceae bacterium]|nr:ankyrin repeat domain-containing protein [Pyrinomonadaceae bacterium]